MRTQNAWINRSNRGLRRVLDTVFLLTLLTVGSAHAQQVKLLCAGKFAHPKDYCDAMSPGSMPVITNIQKNIFTFYCYTKKKESVFASSCTGVDVAKAFGPAGGDRTGKVSPEFQKLRKDAQERADYILSRVKKNEAK